jgi:alpha-glucosidase
MKKSMTLLFLILGVILNAQTLTVKSPDNRIEVTISNYDKLIYSVSYNGRVIINPSQLGFEFKDKLAMTGNFITVDQSVKNFNETWIPVVKSKYAEIVNNYNELQLTVKEKSGLIRFSLWQRFNPSGTSLI